MSLYQIVRVYVCTTKKIRDLKEERKVCDRFVNLKRLKELLGRHFLSKR